MSTPATDFADSSDNIIKKYKNKSTYETTVFGSGKNGKRLLSDPATQDEYQQYRNTLGRCSWVSVICPELTAPASIL